ncbi:carboxymuconolactone decarboxylase family protein [Phenylobacterium sp.]|uniref:carboxymuconolactone decarboxylase family protein n=1 Tax=Phenylobacterium sp. TaxID=1871053 RepID=UPI002DEF2E3A|nr:carboxymuconolactone decarboxylase family protein [Phenylobacterium sp.]
MARVPPADPATFTGSIAESFKGPAGRTQVFGYLALAPTCMPAFSQLTRALFTSLELPEIDRELLVLAVAHLQGGEYEWVQHVAILESMGAPAATVAAIAADDWENPVFTPAQRALLRFGRESVRHVQVADAVFAEAARHYSPRQIVEAIYTIGAYMFMARLTQGLQVGIDPPQGPKVLAAAKAAQA